MIRFCLTLSLVFCFAVLLEPAFGQSSSERDYSCRPVPGEPSMEDPPGDNVIHLKPKPGSDITQLILDNLKPGNEVHLPGGTYKVSESWTDGMLNNCSLIGDGMVYLDYGHDFKVGAHQFFTDGGDFELRNVTINNRRGKSTFQVMAKQKTDTIVLRHFHQPHGSKPEVRNLGSFVVREHAGTAWYIDCEIVGFTDNGIYGSAPSRRDQMDNGKRVYGGNGPVHVLRGFFSNNNNDGVRVATDGSTVRDVVVVMNAPANPTAPGRNVNQRGIWVKGYRENANILIENCDIFIDSNVVKSQGGIKIVPESKISGVGSPKGGGIIRNCRIMMNYESYPIDIEGDGEWTIEDVDLSGNGPTEIKGGTGPRKDIVSGKKAEKPRMEGRFCPVK